MFMTYLMYRYAFLSNQIGYAYAISFIFFLIIAIFTGILFATSKAWIFYEEATNMKHKKRTCLKVENVRKWQYP